MQFSDVIGQSNIKQQLVASVQQNRVSHAQLFLGPLGHGSLPLAMAYAQYLICENPGPDDACGTCPACVKATKFVHPDIHFSFPFPSIQKRKTAVEFYTEWREMLTADPYLDLQQWMLHFDAENKQANIPIAECHDIIRKLTFKTYEAPYKILIMWLPEYLGKEGNTLLKILEEPPEKTLFILVAEGLDHILNTIISRTQLLKIPAIDADVLTEKLKADHGLSHEEALNLAGLSGGNYALARQLIENSGQDQSSLIVSWMRLILTGKMNRKALVDWVDGFAGLGREKQKLFFMYGLHILRETMQYSLTDQPSALLTQTEQQMVQYLAKMLSVERLQKFYETLNEEYYHIERNANPKILMLDTSIKLHVLLTRKLELSQQGA